MMKKPVARKGKKQALSQKAYDYLVQKLLSHQLVPGDLINRRQVAKELKISVAPVLEAMVQLQNDGFLESIPRKGTLVKSIKPEDLRGGLILREAYECQAARLYCGEPVRRSLPALRALAKAIEGAPEGKVRWQKEYEFHHALLSLTECPALVDAFEKVMRRGLFIALNLYLSEHPDTLRDNHLHLLDALVVDDPDLAEHAIRRHFLGRAHLAAKPSGSLRRR